MRDTLLTIHILAAGLWIGTSVVGLVVNPRINPRAAPIASDHWHHTVAAFKNYLYVPSYLIVLVTGVLLVTAVDDSPYEMSDTFVLVGFLAVIVGAVTSMIVIDRLGRRVAAAYDADDVRAASSLEQRIATWVAVDIAVIAVATVAMVSKWGI